MIKTACQVNFWTSALLIVPNVKVKEKLSQHMLSQLRSTLFKSAKGHILPENPLVLALPFMLPHVTGPALWPSGAPVTLNTCQFALPAVLQHGVLGEEGLGAVGPEAHHQANLVHGVCVPP